MQERLFLKEELESIYDVPFMVESGEDKYDPWYSITPYNKEQSLFTIRLIFRNALRLIMDFEPQKYGADLVRSMGAASKEQRLAFCSFAKIITEKGGKIDFAINDFAKDPINPINWPDQWGKVRIRVTVMPITDQEEPHSIPYAGIADEWGCLMMGMVCSLLAIVPLDASKEAIIGYEEGNKEQIQTNRYERNPINRVLCLKKYGYVCKVCGFDFAAIYGDIGKEFIHVHHTVPVSKMGEHYIVDPLSDLVPVCPNCHAMLHKTVPPFTVDELKARLRKA